MAPAVRYPGIGGGYGRLYDLGATFYLEGETLILNDMDGPRAQRGDWIVKGEDATLTVRRYERDKEAV